MPLAKAIRKNTLALATAQMTYKENVVAINTLINSVLTSSLPESLKVSTPDWNEFSSAYVAARADALGWVNGVLAKLLDVPGEIRAYNTIVPLLLKDATVQANVLLRNPKDTNALAILNNDLQALGTQLNMVLVFVRGALDAVRSFKDTLPDMATRLSAIADKSAKDARADQTRINLLAQAISQLHSHISSLIAEMVVLGIVDGIALTMGAVASFVAWPVGLLAWFLFGPVIAVASYRIKLDADVIAADRETIDKITKQMDGLTSNVATLHLLAQSYSAMAAQTRQVEGNLQAVLEAWTSLQNDVNLAIDDIKNAQHDSSCSRFAAVLTDIADAANAWEEAYKQAGVLVLDINVSTAQLQVGMSSEQVQAAIAQSQTIGAIRYYNEVAGRHAQAA